MNSPGQASPLAVAGSAPSAVPIHWEPDRPGPFSGQSMENWKGKIWKGANYMETWWTMPVINLPIDFLNLKSTHRFPEFTLDPLESLVCWDSIQQCEKPFISVASVVGSKATEGWTPTKKWWVGTLWSETDNFQLSYTIPAAQHDLKRPSSHSHHVNESSAYKIRCSISVL